MKPDLLIELDATFDALSAQLADDHKRWGDEWKRRPRQGQEYRIFDRMWEYLETWENDGTPIPWLKIMGLAHIAIVREWMDMP